MKKAWIAGMVALVLVLGGVAYLLMTSSDPDEVAYKLYEDANGLVAEADALFKAGKLNEASAKYKEAMEIARTIIEQYPETLSVDSAAMISQRCKRRLGAFGPPKEVVDSMIKSVGAPSAEKDEYLTYWDFHHMASQVLAEEWDLLTEEKRQRFVDFCRDGTHGIVGENSDVIQLVVVTLLGEEIDSDQARVETQWEVKAINQSERVPFRLVRVENLWKIYDFEIVVLGGGPSLLLRQGLDRCASGTSIADFLGLPDFSDRLEQCYRDLMKEMEAGMQGNFTGRSAPGRAGAAQADAPWKVIVESEAMQGDTSVGTVPAGELVDVLGEGETDMGKLVLISWDSGTGPPTVGWISADHVEKR